MDSTARFSFLCTWAWSQIRAACLLVKPVLRRWEQVNPWVGKSPSRRKPWASWPWSVTLWAFSGTREGLKTERLVEKYLYESRWTLQQRDNNTWSFTAKLLWWQLVLWRSKVLCSLKACGEQFGFWAVEKSPRSRRADCISSSGFSGFFMAVSGMASGFSCRKLPMFSKDTPIVSEDALHTTTGFGSVPGAPNVGFPLPFWDLMGFFRSADCSGPITFG